MNMTVECPECGGEVNVGPKAKKGQWLTCPHCNVELEVIGVNPLELDWADYVDDEEEEPWDEDDEFWDEDDFDDEDFDFDDDDEEEWDEEEF